MITLKEFSKECIIKALTLEAKVVLKRHRPKIICVSGSIGKTSTKDAIFEVVSKKYSARKSEKSYNSEFGVPLTILGLKTGWSSPMAWLENIFHGLIEALFSRTYPDWLVLEVGADKPGEIQAISKWLPCDIAVLTAFPDNPVHVEFFKSEEALFLEDMQVAYKLPETGEVVASGDDKNLARFLPNLKAHITTIGFSKNLDWKASPETIEYNQDGRVEGITFSVVRSGETYHVHFPGLVGGHQIYPLLSALAVGELIGLSPSEGIEALKTYVPPPGRLRVIPGIKETTIIDDSYNSSPAAAEAALVALSKIKTKGRRIAVLGDMLELGVKTPEAHRTLGTHVGTVCDFLIAVGLRSKFIVEGAKERGMKDDKIFWFSDSVVAGRQLQDLLSPNDVVLVKGSQGMRMERVVEEVMLEPDKKEAFLCRQDLEWLNKK